MRKQLKSIVVAGMIATLSFATLAGCGSKSTAKNDETTISDTVKQTQKQTEKTTEATTATESTAAEEVTTEAESTEAEVSGNAIVAAEPANEVVAAAEPAYVPADTSAEEPVDNTPAPTEPAAHEHNWTPVYCYVEWIENETGEDTHRRYIDENGNEVVITQHDFRNDGKLIDHYECECGETKTGEDHEKIENYKNTKQISKNGLFYYRNDTDFTEQYFNTQMMRENLISTH